MNGRKLKDNGRGSESCPFGSFFLENLDTETESDDCVHVTANGEDNDVYKVHVRERPYKLHLDTLPEGSQSTAINFQVSAGADILCFSLLVVGLWWDPTQSGVAHGSFDTAKEAQAALRRLLMKGYETNDG